MGYVRALPFASIKELQSACALAPVVPEDREICASSIAEQRGRLAWVRPERLARRATHTSGAISCEALHADAIVWSAGVDDVRATAIGIEHDIHVLRLVVEGDDRVNELKRPASKRGRCQSERELR
jgi:hypothetical protein